MSRNLSGLTLGLRLLTMDLRRQLFSRKALFNLVVQLLPVVFGLIFIILRDLDGMTLFRNLVESVYLPLLIPLAALFFGGPTIINEVEGRTITYLTLRPISRPALFLAKFGASLISALAITVVPIILLFATCMVGSAEPLADALPIFGSYLAAVIAGTVTYTAIFTLLAVLFYATLLPGIVYYLVVEFVMSAVPVLELLSVKFHIRTIAGLQGADRGGFLDRLILDEPLAFEWWVGLMVCGIFTAVAVSAATLAFRNRQFHV